MLPMTDCFVGKEGKVKCILLPEWDIFVFRLKMWRIACSMEVWILGFCVGNRSNRILAIRATMGLAIVEVGSVSRSSGMVSRRESLPF